jgi:hypothetical protein
MCTDQNALEDLHNLMLATGTNDFGTVAEGSYLGKAALNSDTDWNSFIAGSFDDAQVCHSQTSPVDSPRISLIFYL